MHFWNPQLNPSRLTPLLGDFIQVRGLGAWSQNCMECPQVGRAGLCLGKMPAIDSKLAVHVLHYV